MNKGFSLCKRSMFINAKFSVYTATSLMMAVKSLRS